MDQLRLPDELLPVARVNAQAEIVRLRAAGYGPSAVARSLNQRGVPTPSGRGRWFPETVKRHADPVERMRWARYIADYRARHR